MDNMCVWEMSFIHTYTYIERSSTLAAAEFNSCIVFETMNSLIFSLSVNQYNVNRIYYFESIYIPSAKASCPYQCCARKHKIFISSSYLYSEIFVMFV